MLVRTVPAMHCFEAACVAEKRRHLLAYTLGYRSKEIRKQIVKREVPNTKGLGYPRVNPNKDKCEAARVAEKVCYLVAHTLRCTNKETKGHEQ